MSASPDLVVSSFERYILTTVATVVLLMIDSIPSVRRCLSRASSHCIEGEHIALVIGQFWRSVSFNSPFSALELRALETWLARPAKESGCTVTVCGSHVKRVVKLVVESPATVGLGLRSQLFIMSLTTLSLRCVGVGALTLWSVRHVKESVAQ